MSGRIAIVTGAGSGVGRAVALALGRKGYRLVLAGRRLDPLQATAKMIPEGAGDAVIHPTDVTDEKDVESLFGAAVASFGRVDLLFNNAGTAAPELSIENVSLDVWKSVIDVNVTGAFLCLREAFRVMKSQYPQGGRIINNGSISAHSPRPNSFPYTASKHAITGLTKSAALDGRAFSIACGQIDIGNAETDMTKRMQEGVAQANGATVPEPVMDVSNVGQAVVYMDSLPLSANVLSLTVMATNMPFVGRG